MKRGFWNLTLDGVAHSDISQATLDHIASLITQGFTSGEVIEDDNARLYQRRSDRG